MKLEYGDRSHQTAAVPVAECLLATLLLPALK